MKQVVQLRLTPVGEHADALTTTLETCNAAANQVSEVAFARRVFRNFGLRRLVYGMVREYGLGAQAAQHVIKKVADAYTTLHANLRNGNLGRPGSKRYEQVAAKPIRFRPQAAQPYDQRNLSFDLDAQTVSMWTVTGRVKPIPYVGSPEALKLLGTCQSGETDLLCRDGIWLLHVTVEVPEEPLNTTPAGWLGVDLGIVNIATTSDGTIHAGRKLNRHRRRQAELRRKLQAKNTKSAKRVLKRQRRREARHARDTNHVISKRIVAEAERTGRGIALEDLTGIRGRARSPQAPTGHAALLGVRPTRRVHLV